MNFFTVINTPLCSITLTATDNELTGAHFGNESDIASKSAERNDNADIFTRTRAQFDEYFTGERMDFDLPLAANGTVFQHRVWRELCSIPFGTTISYGELAARIGNPNASRAVGLANGQNPIAIIVPCHRVIGANGKLVGYAGGLSRKIALLDFESAVRATGPQPFDATVAGVSR